MQQKGVKRRAPRVYQDQAVRDLKRIQRAQLIQQMKKIKTKLRGDRQGPSKRPRRPFQPTAAKQWTDMQPYFSKTSLGQPQKMMRANQNSKMIKASTMKQIGKWHVATDGKNPIQIAQQAQSDDELATFLDEFVSLKFSGKSAWMLKNIGWKVCNKVAQDWYKKDMAKCSQNQKQWLYAVIMIDDIWDYLSNGAKQVWNKVKNTVNKGIHHFQNSPMLQTIGQLAGTALQTRIPGFKSMATKAYNGLKGVTDYDSYRSTRGAGGGSIGANELNAQDQNAVDISYLNSLLGTVNGTPAPRATGVQVSTIYKKIRIPLTTSSQGLINFFVCPQSAVYPAQAPGAATRFPFIGINAVNLGIVTCFAYSGISTYDGPFADLTLDGAIQSYNVDICRAFVDITLSSLTRAGSNNYSVYYTQPNGSWSLTQLNGPGTNSCVALTLSDMINNIPSITYNNATAPVQLSGNTTLQAQYYQKLANDTQGAFIVGTLTGLPANTAIGFLQVITQISFTPSSDYVSYFPRSCVGSYNGTWKFLKSLKKQGIRPQYNQGQFPHPRGCDYRQLLTTVGGQFSKTDLDNYNYRQVPIPKRNSDSCVFDALSYLNQGADSFNYKGNQFKRTGNVLMINKKVVPQPIPLDIVRTLGIPIYESFQGGMPLGIPVIVIDNQHCGILDMCKTKMAPNQYEVNCLQVLFKELQIAGQSQTIKLGSFTIYPSESGFRVVKNGVTGVAKFSYPINFRSQSNGLKASQIFSALKQSRFAFTITTPIQDQLHIQYQRIKTDNLSMTKTISLINKLRMFTDTAQYWNGQYFYRAGSTDIHILDVDKKIVRKLTGPTVPRLQFQNLIKNVYVNQGQEYQLFSWIGNQLKPIKSKTYKDDYKGQRMHRNQIYKTPLQKEAHVNKKGQVMMVDGQLCAIKNRMIGQMKVSRVKFQQGLLQQGYQDQQEELDENIKYVLPKQLKHKVITITLIILIAQLVKHEIGNDDSSTLMEQLRSYQNCQEMQQQQQTSDQDQQIPM